MKLYATGIRGLDRLLGGGLLPNRGYMVTGSMDSGHRLLAMHVLKESLFRGEYCLYVTYGQSYRTIMDDLRALSIDPEKFMKSNLLRITDYFSLDFYKIEELKAKLSPIEKQGVIFILPEDLEDEEKRKSYVKIHQDSIRKTGKPGVVIIDSLNERLGRTPRNTVLKQWRNFRERLTKRSGLLALHLFTPLVHEDLTPFAEMFHYYEDGTIELRADSDGKRWLRIKFRMPPAIDNSWHRFIIRGNKIVIRKKPETEYIDVQADMVVQPVDIKVGEYVNIRIAINARKEHITLVKLEGIIPEGFELKEKPEACMIEGCHLDMQRKRLDSLETKDIRLRLKSLEKGVFPLRPRISYLDKAGKSRLYKLEPITISVKEPGISDWIKGE